MARELQGFYKTSMWQNVRKLYIQSVGGLCERCYAKGIIKHGDTVHHKIHLTAQNVHDPDISMNPDNLILLCRDCHAEVHRGVKRYKVNERGEIIACDT